MATQTLRVGILSASSTIEKTFLPTLQSLPALFKLSTIYNVNKEVLKSLQEKFSIPESTTSIHELLQHPEVDLILNLLPFEYHEYYTIQALKNGKHVMVEAPLGMSAQTLPYIRAAIEQGTTENHKPAVFISCARRYAPCYTGLFMSELKTLDRISYARCRNITGPLEVHSIPDFAPAPPESTSYTNGIADRMQAMGQLYSSEPTPGSQLHSLLLNMFLPSDMTPGRAAMVRFLGTTGCHDLSLIREVLGYPDAVTNFSHTDPFYNTVFHYNGDGRPFTLVWEAGADSLPRCDSHLTVYGDKKTISLQYDFPCIGGETEGGFGVRVVVEEIENSGVDNENGASAVPRIKRTEAVSSVAEVYECELRAMHSYFVEGERDGAKSTNDDALFDLKMMKMIIRRYDRQWGTIRSPLG